MHIIGPDHFDDNDDAAIDFSIRSKVRAIPCPGGAQLTDDDGNVTASYADDCYVIEGDDGDHRIASRYVFDALYETSADFDEAGDFAADQGDAEVPTPEQADALTEPATATQPTKQAPAKKAASGKRGGRR